MLSGENQRLSRTTKMTAQRRITSCLITSPPPYDPLGHFRLAWICWPLAQNFLTLKPWQKYWAILIAILNAIPAIWLVYLYHVVQNHLLWLAVYHSALCTTDAWEKKIENVFERGLISNFNYLNNSFISSSYSLLRVDSKRPSVHYTEKKEQCQAKLPINKIFVDRLKWTKVLETLTLTRRNRTNWRRLLSAGNMASVLTHCKTNKIMSRGQNNVKIWR